MYERCPFCSSPSREIRSVAGKLTEETAKTIVVVADVMLPYGLWWRCLRCGADYGYIQWSVQQLVVGNRWAPSGRQEVKRGFDFWTTDVVPERRIMGAFNYLREIVKLTEVPIARRGEGDTIEET